MSPESATPVTAALRIPMAAGDLDAGVRAGLEVVERQLHDAVQQVDPLADDAARHLVRAGGKRSRPLLTLLAAHLGDPLRPEVIEAAIVVELTHLATLYHDDVMDGADRRRGAPSVHAQWGNTVAILTGDLLFARASMIVAALGPEAVRIQAATFERLCLGQLHETIGPRDGEDPVEHYLTVLADKTGSLIATAARFGAMFAGCAESVQQVLIAYGEKVGVAFQLADDVIDLSSDAAVTGKTPGTDLREHVPTLPVLLLRRHVSSSGPGVDAESVALLAALDGDLADDAVLADVVARLAVHPVTGQARAEASRWAAEAAESLAALEPSPARDALRDFASAVVARTA
ncbi:MAG: polyprenyl synthetase family protein [Kineosporiaceae bacterium]|nr:polyprenyl synthetase family protein [Kineosporiaceae bacterium]MBK7624045.1 polyprenyl synthetase family protein [Kineosporiaceae bacterium]MBK8075800.1 polyprenyl synthetase family protein [Kineosporiaceae bacterium]